MTSDRPDVLTRIAGVLAVVAHPDDESFGLGAVLSELVMADAWAGAICFTHGEASTLHGTPGALFTVRSQELQAAGTELRLSRVELHRYPDSHLDAVPIEELADHVLRVIREEHPAACSCSTPTGSPRPPAGNPGRADRRPRGRPAGAGVGAARGRRAATQRGTRHRLHPPRPG